MTWGREYWTWFLTNVSLQFIIAELIAIVSGNYANTLSEYARSELGLVLIPNQPLHHTIAWVLSLVAWWLFVGVITWHIWFVANAH